jgi:hypothetical protein
MRRLLNPWATLLAASGLVAVGCDQAAQEGEPTADGVVSTDPGGVSVTGDTGGRTPGPDGCYPDECEIDGRCWLNGDPEPDNLCRICRVPVDRLAWSPDDAGACDDEDACTTGDRCEDGACVADPVCDDGNPCTEDLCDKAGGTCSTAPNSAACVPADPCIQGQCGDGACQSLGTTRDCGDQNPCTTDACEPGAGCVHGPDAAGTCDDGNPCTIQDACAGTACKGTPKSCDDQNLCTADACKVSEGCIHNALGHLCTDTNPCTEAACDPEKGCVFPFNTAVCDDANPCTAEDGCSGGACKGASISVDDLNPCTDDGCDPVLGVVHLANALPCEDGNLCTLGDSCGGGACFAGSGTPECGDQNPCTDDSCLPESGCRNQNNTVPCDDATACTSLDTCVTGSCEGTPVVCDDSNACTTDSCDPVGGCLHALVVSKACRPAIIVTSPARGATIEAANSFEKVAVTGTVSSGAGPITSFNVNGAPVAVDEAGAFSTQVTPTVGGNLLVLEATDGIGTVRKVVQSYLWSTAYHKPVKSTPKSGMVTQGVGIWLDQEVIDDGSRAQPPDDFATIFEMVMASFEFGDLVPSPVLEKYGYSIYLNNLTHEKPKVSLAPVSGGLQMTATISNVTADVEAIGKWLPDFSGDLSISAITIAATISLSVANHEVVAEVTSTDVTLTGTDLTINGVLGWLFDFLVDWLVDSFVPDIEQKFEAEIPPKIEPILEDGLSSFAFSTSFDLSRLDGSGSIPIELVTDFQATSFSSSGGAITLRAGGYADALTPYSNLGVPGRINCKSGAQGLQLPKTAAIELSVADDTLNQLLFAAWTGGLLEFTAPPSMLGKFDLTAYGVSDLALTVSGMLAPTASDCNPEGKLLLHLGDLKLTATAKVYGQPLNVTIYASVVAGLEITATSGELGIKVAGVESSNLQVDIAEEGLLALEGTLEELLKEKLVTGLIGALGGDSLASFPLPSIDLSKALPALPPGTVIAIAPTSVKRDGGNTIVSGNLQ